MFSMGESRFFLVTMSHLREGDVMFLTAIERTELVCM